jgi:AraC-like DNA-binding protein
VYEHEGNKRERERFLKKIGLLMIYKLENRLLPKREPNQATDWGYLTEDFAAWRGVALAKNTANMPADHENSFSCACFQRLCGAGLCDIADNLTPQEVEMDQRVLTVIALMKDDPRRALPLSRLAQSVNLSPTRLWYLFKTETGSPPGRYLKTLRMQDATMLLVDTFLSVKEIIARVGFTDESHFVRDFKRIYGVTPTEYRKQNVAVDASKVAATNGRKDRLRDSKKRQ